MMDSARLLIVGLGNPVLGDDGIGWRVAEAVRQTLAETDSPIAVDCLAVGGLRLMEHLIGCEAAILIDAIETGYRPPGSVTSFPLEALGDPMAGHLGSTHDASLPTALDLGRALGAPLPGQVWIVAVETRLTLEFTEVLGISALIEPYTYSGTVRAGEACHTLMLDARALRGMCELDAKLAYGMMRQVAQAAMSRLQEARVQLAAARA